MVEATRFCQGGVGGRVPLHSIGMVEDHRKRRPHDVVGRIDANGLSCVSEGRERERKADRNKSFTTKEDDGRPSFSVRQRRLATSPWPGKRADLAAVLLGSGVRLFDHLAGTPAVLATRQ